MQLMTGGRRCRLRAVGHSETAQVLIRHGAAVNESHLTLASGSGDVECIEILRKEGNVEVTASAILKAQKCGHQAAVQRLLLPPIAASVSSSTLALIQAPKEVKIGGAQSLTGSAPRAAAHPQNPDGV